jgi:hypothetical protein
VVIGWLGLAGAFTGATAGALKGYYDYHGHWMPGPDDDSGGSPRSNAGSGYYVPIDDGSGGGPRSLAFLPGPDDEGPGTPRSSGLLPAPDDSGSGTPRSMGDILDQLESAQAT